MYISTVSSGKNVNAFSFLKFRYIIYFFLQSLTFFSLYKICSFKLREREIFHQHQHQQRSHKPS